MYELKTLALAHHKAAVEETVFADSLKNCHRQPMGHSALFYCLDLYLETNAIFCLTFAQHTSFFKRESRQQKYLPLYSSEPVLSFFGRFQHQYLIFACITFVIFYASSYLQYCDVFLTFRHDKRPITDFEHSLENIFGDATTFKIESTFHKLFLL